MYPTQPPASRSWLAPEALSIGGSWVSLSVAFITLPSASLAPLWRKAPPLALGAGMWEGPALSA